MQLNQSQALTVHKVISQWEQSELITPDMAQTLKKSYTVRTFDWKALARYSFVTAIVFGVVAVVSMFADRALIRFFESLVDQIYSAPNFILALICAIVAGFFYYFGEKKKQEKPEQIFTNEGFILLGATFTTFTVANLAKLFGAGDIYYIMTFLMATIVFAALSLKMRNALLWLFALISVSVLLGVVSGVVTHWKAYLLGMNFPVRYIVIGALLLATCWYTRKNNWWKGFYPISRFFALLLLFTALWASSVFGNQPNFDSWTNTPQWHFWPWALLSTAAAITAVYLGWKRQLITLRSFGIAFLIANIYSRYFEYFWNGSHKAFFFIILAISFWFIGRSAEKIWNVDFIKKPKAD